MDLHDCDPEFLQPVALHSSGFDFLMQLNKHIFLSPNPHCFIRTGVEYGQKQEFTLQKDEVLFCF